MRALSVNDEWYFCSWLDKLTQTLNAGVSNTLNAVKKSLIKGLKGSAVNLARAEYMFCDFEGQPWICDV